MPAPATLPVSLEHLDRYTGGNRDLNEEVLRLFEGQCFALVEQLEALAGSENGKAWHDVAHTLKGASRGIGAFALADAAAAAEVQGPSAEATQQRLAELKDAAASVHAFIVDFLAQG